MSELYGPDRLLRAYFALHVALSSNKALMFDGMPPTGNPGAAAHLRARLADLAWYVQDLTEDDKRLTAARLLGFGGVAPSYRYLFSPSDLAEDEVPTGQRHPNDQRCFEVKGTRVLQPKYKELADYFGVSTRDVRQAVSRARSLVGRRICEKPPNHLWERDE